MVVNTDLVKQLTSIKDKKGIRLTKLAEMTGIEEKELSRILSGIDSPTLDSLNKIAEVLDMKIILVDNLYVIE